MVNYYFDMDGVLTNFHKEKYSYANASSREWIFNLEPFIDNVNIVRSLIRGGDNVYILSKCATEQAKEGKFDWLKKYLPEIPKENIIIIVGNGKKVDYIQTSDGVLIDDDIKNVRPWRKNGYKAILLENKGEKIDIKKAV